MLRHAQYDDYSGGDCFIVALKNVMDDGPNGSMVLCHGIVHGQGPLEGIVFPHAWNEIGEYVLDESNGHNLLIDRQTYYAVGDIDTVYRYDFYEMAEMADRYGTYGPWEPDLQFDWRNAKVAFPMPTHKDLEDAARQICVQLGLDQDSVAIIQNIIEAILWNNPVMFGKRENMGARIANSGTIEYEDDVVVVLDPDGHEDYKGIFDYCPYKEDVDDGLFRFDPISKVYKGVDGTIAEGYTMQKIAQEDIRVPDRPDPDGNYGTCPVCDSPSFDGTTCTVCGYTEYPEGFGEVDTDSVEDPEISDDEKELDEDEQDTSKDDDTSEEEDDEDIDFDDDDDDEDEEEDFDDDDDDEDDDDDDDDEEDEDMKKKAQAILDGRQFNLFFEDEYMFYGWSACKLTDDMICTVERMPLGEWWVEILEVRDGYPDENYNTIAHVENTSLDAAMKEMFGPDVQYVVEFNGRAYTNGTTASVRRAAQWEEDSGYIEFDGWDDETEEEFFGAEAVFTLEDDMWVCDVEGMAGEYDFWGVGSGEEPVDAFQTACMDAGVTYADPAFDDVERLIGKSAGRKARKASRRKKADYGDSLDLRIEVPMYVTCNVTISHEGDEDFSCWIEPEAPFPEETGSWCAQGALEEAFALYDTTALTDEMKDAYRQAMDWEDTIDPIED